MSEVAKKEITKICMIAGGISLVVAIGVVAAYHFTVAKDEDEGKESQSDEK